MVISGILCAASLGAASRITVTIAASDDAHGVFQLSPESLAVNGTEPEDGRSAVVLQVSEILVYISEVPRHNYFFIFLITSHI